MSANDRDRASGNPQRDGKKQQKQQAQPGQSSGSQQQQQVGSGAGNQYGEGNYKATRDYNRGLKEHMQSHDIEREARDAEPRSEEEARQMEEAEREGKDKARDSDASDRRNDRGTNPATE